MADTFVTPSLVARYITIHLWNNLVAAKCVHRAIADEFKGDRRTGGTITIKKPFEFRVNDGATISTVDDIYQRSFTMTATTRKNVNFDFTSQELTHDYFMSKTQEELIKPAMQALANHIDQDILATAYKKCPNQVGTPGTTPSSTKIVRQARQKLTEHGVPDDDCHCILDPSAVTEIGENVKSLLHTELVGKAVQGTPQKGSLGFKLSGMNMYESNQLPTHTTGSQAGVAGATKNGASSEEDTTLAFTGLGTSNTITEGDIFTIGSVYAVNPSSGNAYSYLRQFVAGAAGSAGVSGTASAGALSAQTAIPGTSPYNIRFNTGTSDKKPYQNVSALPANSAALTVAGSASTAYPISLAFHRNAIALATVPLHMPERTCKFTARQTWNNISLRIVADYDVLNDKEIYRVDVLYGIAVMEPFAMCRIIG